MAQKSTDRPELKNPPEIKSKNGVLDVELDVGLTTIEVGGKRVTTHLYNGLFAPPTLRLRPGEKLRLKLRNNREGPTNLHFHGILIQ